MIIALRISCISYYSMLIHSSILLLQDNFEKIVKKKEKTDENHQQLN